MQMVEPHHRRAPLLAYHTTYLAATVLGCYSALLAVTQLCWLLLSSVGCSNVCWWAHNLCAGDAYTGNWITDRYGHGGLVRYADGSSFEGRFREGNRHKPFEGDPINLPTACVLQSIHCSANISSVSASLLLLAVAGLLLGCSVRLADCLSKHRSCCWLYHYCLLVCVVAGCTGELV